MNIKHLVIAGGGPTIFQSLGAIQHLEQQKFIEINNIQSIYGTSAGAIVGTLLCLKYDWDTINDYMIKRPWHEVFPINVQNIFDAYTKRGLFDIKTIEKCVKPLLDAKDLSIDINLKEFYEYSNIELHMFSLELNEFKLVDISYKTHPDISLIKAIQMTASLPVILSPAVIDSKCYVDGGIICNYPLQYCLNINKEEEVLGFKNHYNSYNNNKIDSSSTLLDYVMHFIFKIIYSLSTDDVQPKIKNEVICNSNLMNLENLKNSLKSIETRKELLNNGIESATHFLSNIQT